MDKKAKINEFKKEFAEEIDKTYINIEDLKKNKISSSVLEAETMLRKIFGDEIYSPKKFNEEITGEKEIVKLTEEDVSFDSQVRDICENIADAEFDNNLGVFLSKVNSEVEE